MRLELLRVPAPLDGSADPNRAPVPAHRVEMNTDLQAVNAWNTIRGARIPQEAERLLLWAIVAKGRPLSSFNTLDVDEYLEQFLANPQPVERWIGRGQGRAFRPDLAAILTPAQWRCVLWCVLERGQPMSSILVDDREA